MIETPRYHPYLTARETLAMLARLSGITAPDTNYWLARVGLKDAAGRKVHHFSVGMKQRLGIAAALVSHSQELLDPGRTEPAAWTRRASRKCAA